MGHDFEQKHSAGNGGVDRPGVARAGWKATPEETCLEPKHYASTARQREVLSALDALARPSSQHALLQHFSDLGRPMNAVTLYRTLKVLEEQRLIHRLVFAGGYVPCQFVDDAGGHHHLVCRVCGHVKEVPCTNMADVEAAATSASGFLIERHYVEFVGICPDCQ